MRSPVIVPLFALAVVVTGCATREASRSAPAAPLAALNASAPRARPASTQGSRGSTAVGRFVRERNAQLQFCYDEARASRTNLAGTLTISVSLGDGGEVLASEIVRRSWSGDGADVERCVLATIRRWRFPSLEPDDDHDHSFAVIFSSEGTTEQAPRRDD
jgi:outer membrane biosynthesis protein TonB